MSTPSRRRLLASLCLGTVALAGCSDPESADVVSQPESPAPSDTPGTGDEEASPTDASLDLAEANVVGVSIAREDGEAVRFQVTLHHDDDGEDGYANWWQVETLAGERLGRRELMHAHSDQPFTRSDTIEIPADVACVVVRGHDETHGYGGQAMVVTIESGSTKVVRQGSSRESLSSVECPDAE